MSDSNYWIVGARLIDGTGAQPREKGPIGVSNGRIVSLSRPPQGARVIDAHGLTVTPGLIDAHVHIWRSSHIHQTLNMDLSVAELAADMFSNLSDTLSAGFTTVRDTGGIDGGIAQAVRGGRARGPRVLQCGPMLCQTGGHGHYTRKWEASADFHQHSVPGLRGAALLSDGVDAMRRNAREAFRRGADFLKLCVTGGVLSRHDRLSDTQLSVEEIAVAVEEARARSTYVTVHAHNNEGIRRAIAAGVQCVEHGSEIDDDTAQLMAEHDVALVPTLTVAHALATDPVVAGLDANLASRVGDILQGATTGLLAARAAGVRVGLGSDLIGPNQAARRGEELLRRARIETPMLALQSATAINAEILGIADDVGTIEIGKIADLVAFDGNPMEMPEVFANPDAAKIVVAGGVVVKDSR